MTEKNAARFFADGIALFNRGRFFECHEAWEEVWKRAHGKEKRFYQGLIQAAVAILHAEKGNLRGAASLYRKAREKLDPLPDEYMGLALGELRAELADFFAIAICRRGRRLAKPPKLRGPAAVVR